MDLQKTRQNSFEDFKINVKIQLSALWTSVTLCYLYGDYFELYVPGKVEGLVNGNNLLNTPFQLFLATFVLAIPALMVAISLFLGPRMNRILNILFGSFFTIIMVLIVFTSLNSWRYFYAFLAIIESCITACIVWNAYKWPKTDSNKNEGY